MLSAYLFEIIMHNRPTIFAPYISFWNRTPKPESLLKTSLCPSLTSISVTRDPVSGELLGYNEVITHLQCDVHPSMHNNNYDWNTF